jgi:hypothetical protein
MIKLKYGTIILENMIMEAKSILENILIEAKSILEKILKIKKSVFLHDMLILTELHQTPPFIAFCNGDYMTSLNTSAVALAGIAKWLTKKPSYNGYRFLGFTVSENTHVVISKFQNVASIMLGCRLSYMYYNSFGYSLMPIIRNPNLMICGSFLIGFNEINPITRNFTKKYRNSGVIRHEWRMSLISFVCSFIDMIYYTS